MVGGEAYVRQRPKTATDAKPTSAMGYHDLSGNGRLTKVVCAALPDPLPVTEPRPQVLKQGTGSPPKADGSTEVVVHYVGQLASGKVFDR